MNKKQWKAVYDYCEAAGYERPSELLQELKMQGVIDRNDTIDGLSRYPNGNTYDDMLYWLKENC